jgi:thiol-disulfide isomerase/thioredoxin
MTARRITVVVVAALALLGCGSDDAPERPRGARAADVTTARGGVEALPGELPTGVSYRRVDGTVPRAPALTLSLLDGHRVTGRELWRTRPVVLVFFSSWCGPCAQGQAAVDALARRYRDVVAFVGVAGQDERTAVAGYVQRHEVSYAVAVDESLDVWRRYAVREPPAVVLIGPGGRLLRGWPGPIDAGRLQRELDHLVVRAEG